jgi:hypothetical protein
LNVTDIHTTWVETRAVLGRGEVRVRDALASIRQALPFRLCGIDSDNGSEFINDHLYRYCQAEEIQFTRGRPYKKDDNAHIEQKNWTHVRKLVGWDRYDTVAAQQALNALYADLRIFQNLFHPSMKLQRKERRGSRLLRHYDRPRTPFERVRAGAEVDPEKVAHLERVLARTDPFALAQRVAQHLDRIATLRSRAPQPAPRADTPWRGWTFSPRASQARAGSGTMPTHTVGSGPAIGSGAKTVGGVCRDAGGLHRLGKIGK